MVPPRAAGTILFEVEKSGAQPERYYVTLGGGRAEVALDDGGGQPEPDATLSTTDDVFEALVSGRTALLSAAIRNDVRFAGDGGLLSIANRFFAAPTDGAGDDPRIRSQMEAPHGILWRVRLRDSMAKRRERKVD
ncbi:hypothetical protein GCM10029963_75860 [Micromonospora andamanensis]|nr:hypothetical protein Vwe01_44780 [Micromonospora andamanensis]